MNKLRFKDYEWPRNPRLYREEWSRTPKYQTVEKVRIYAGMGPDKVEITGEGVFCGEGAYGQFQALEAVFKERSAGTLVHPVWGGRCCWFTGLELSQEPRENFVSYRFRFTGAQSDGTVPA